MHKLFNNILIPVDFSEVSELAIEKAIDIANHFQCNIHLVYIENERLLMKKKKLLSHRADSALPGSEAKLYQLQNKYTYKLDPGLVIQSAAVRGNKNRSVIEYSFSHRIDLLIIGKPASLSGTLLPGNFNINEITKKVGCPVLTVRKEAGNVRLMNIVLPVCSVLPIRKIMFASYLARKYNSKIHLLAIAGAEDNEQGDRNQYLHKAYQLLRDNTNLDIECHTLRGQNIAETTLRFAKKIDADLIVINPGKESLLSGFLIRFFDGFLFNESRIPVMTISPS
jgi:nucleotide-binding universal stress UspA family protein